MLAPPVNANASGLADLRDFASCVVEQYIYSHLELE